MSGTNPVGSWALPLSTGGGVQDPTTYKGNIDAGFAVAQRVADAFAPKPAVPAAMSVLIDPGFIASETPGGQQSVVEVGAQSVAIAAAPGAPLSRIDLVVVDGATGAASAVAGAPGNPASPPPLPPGKRQVAQIAIASGAVAITAANITDLRAVWSGGAASGVPWALAGGSADAITASYTPPTPNPLPDGIMLGFRAAAANATASPSFAPDGQTAHPITKKGGAALVAGDIPGALAECLLRYNLANARWELINPQVALPSIADKQVLANTSGGSASPVGTGLSAYIDEAIGSTRGAILVRQASGWGLIGPGSSGQVPQSNGIDIAMVSLSLTPPSGSVHQSALSTTAGTVSVGPNPGNQVGAALVLPGGQYGFWPQTAGTTDNFWAAGVYGADNSGLGVGSAAGAASYISLTVYGVGGAPVASATQRYIQASPPYDLGDGPLHGFIFLLLEKVSGRPLATYSAQEAPWIYNGPTDVRPHRVDERGRKFRQITLTSVRLNEVRTGRATIRDYLAASREITECEITQEVYHADMHLIPHPFLNFDSAKHVVVLLDPMHNLIARFLAEQNDGAEIHPLLYSGRVKFDNVGLPRKGPSGVMQVALKV